MPWTVLGLVVSCLVAFNILFVLVIGAAAQRQERRDPLPELEAGRHVLEDDLRT